MSRSDGDVDDLAGGRMPLAGTHVVPTSDDMEEFGRQLGRLLTAGDLVVLTGPLGAGKTTLTRGIGEAMRVRGPVTSPTFVLARTHPSLGGGAPLVHVDAYRLGSALELDDLDIDFARSVVVVEWGSGLLDGVAESWLDVAIERPTGADADDEPAVGEDSVGEDGVGEEGAAEESAGEERPGEEGAAEDDVPEEPRTVTVTAHGPRWSGPAPAA
ncbi:tRNA (adenosine(37)-N6)-threonylcarbamoyltransferase complex ATPase subunit type 1 TsaE [Humibacter sp.]|jgi:tRNA threonylcarbamoyl adenosine modification protein YjeE|uniref:tRNA (adenosine(37)-N6)-threonylcarbamoyltransferase complex ATPase subunit type 1 TsaE n=1 Tax=Humibacter sp. TaxID=1940291 RepID=UPI002C4BFCB1|nr:tRNA (adenosine(37)-N6)-threonylcarbamoyltransferase complex ATPase subunit type 1 TsaE [Humibacter sp.]HVX06459.1 tRNA (adenosine(37)-N6)-threonylcarbamoyltransferase complex ATPase subunit type 1 TsaE [Humibacter sp.]